MDRKTPKLPIIRHGCDTQREREVERANLQLQQRLARVKAGSKHGRSGTESSLGRAEDVSQYMLRKLRTPGEKKSAFGAEVAELYQQLRRKS